VQSEVRRSETVEIVIMGRPPKLIEVNIDLAKAIEVEGLVRKSY
jgi:hypothetical protein